jgi:periplasmic protein TonB
MAREEGSGREGAARVDAEIRGKGGKGTVAPGVPSFEPDKRMAVRALSTARFGFQSLVLTDPRSLGTRRRGPWAMSLAVHAVMIAAVVIAPFFFDDVLPPPDESIRAIIVTPALAVPPPPPPLQPPGSRASARPPVARHPKEPSKFVAPIETPTTLKPQDGGSPSVGGEPEAGISLGVEEGVPGGVEGGVPGGVPGGVVGGVVGGVPSDAPPPPRIVRVGSLNVPKLVRKVDPEYPELAREARLSALIILEVTVDPTGRVHDVTVLRGQPVFDAAAVAAVRQWIYKPLLQNGVPTAFIVTVTLTFNAKAPQLRAG